MTTSASNFVYIYRTKQGKILYVGRGSSAARAAVHQNASHNAALKARLKKREDWCIEIAGPFESKETAVKVETALISAIGGVNIANAKSKAEKSFLNVHPGPAEWRFKPLGLPLHLASRLDEPPVRLTDLKKIAREGAILTHVNESISIEGREISMADLSDDSVVLDRFQKWWRMAGLASQWKKTPAESPRWLLGIAGAPGHQVIIGCAEINAGRWTVPPLDRNAPSGTRRTICIPVMTTKGGAPKIDEMGLRGRFLPTQSSIRFTLSGFISPDRFRTLLGV